MNYISAHIMLSGDIVWDLGKSGSWEPEDGVTLNFSFFQYLSRRNALKEVATALEYNDIVWLRPIGSLVGNWLLDLDTLKAYFEPLQSVGWLRGRISVPPEYESGEREVSDEMRKGTKVQFIVTPRELTSDMPLIDFPELAPFIKLFQADHPDPQHCAFIMMKYEETPLHKQIVKAVRETCSRHGIEALRADDKRYADDLLPNVRTYMHGCSFGIAVFERLTAEDFNPNVSLELGYMMARCKPICLLKDSTLPSLHSDLVGRLYEGFETQQPEESIPPVLEKWLRDKGII